MQQANIIYSGSGKVADFGSYRNKKNTYKKIVSVNDTASFILEAARRSGLIQKVGLSCSVSSVLKTIIRRQLRLKVEKGFSSGGYASILQRDIAEETGLSQRGVIRAVQALRDLELIETVRADGLCKLNYFLTAKFFNLINDAAGNEASDDQLASSPMAENYDILAQTCDNMSGVLLNNINKYKNYSGSNFQSEAEIQEQSDYAENCDCLDAAGNEASSTASPALQISENRKKCYEKCYDPDYSQNAPFESRQRNARQQAKKITKSPESFEKWINGSKYRRENSCIFRRFSQFDIENYYLCSTPAESAGFVAKFKDRSNAERSEQVIKGIISERENCTGILTRANKLTLARAFAGKKSMLKQFQRLVAENNFTDEELGITEKELTDDKN